MNVYAGARTIVINELLKVEIFTATRLSKDADFNTVWESLGKGSHRMEIKNHSYLINTLGS